MVCTRQLCALPACHDLKPMRCLPSALVHTICRSAHHPQGVALAARTLGCKAVICMPTNSPEIKINAVKELGGIVELVGESFYEVRLLYS